MAQSRYDPSSKWLLEHEGSALLYLGGARNIRSCRALQAEVVQPRKLPDGLLEAVIGDRKKPRRILVEVATYPEKRIVDQITGDLRLVHQARKELPDALVIVLCQRGKYRVPSEHVVKSSLGWAETTYRWKVVELWTLSAEELLAAGDVGLMPFVPLTQFSGPPESILHRCRERIEGSKVPDVENLLAVAQVMTGLRFDVPDLLAILGGSNAMIESPLIKEYEDKASNKTAHSLILDVLKDRFEVIPGEVEVAVRQLQSDEQHSSGILLATNCPDLETFLQRVREEAMLPAPKAKSTRGKRKSSG